MIDPYKVLGVSPGASQEDQGYGWHQGTGGWYSDFGGFDFSDIFGFGFMGNQYDTPPARSQEIHRNWFDPFLPSTVAGIPFINPLCLCWHHQQLCFCDHRGAFPEKR